MEQQTQEERIIKEHRRWTQWLEKPHLTKMGNLVLTNRRLIYLHKTQNSPDLQENIKKLAAAPMEKVLNYAFGLNRNNFQFPLSAVIRVRISTFKWNPFPHICLNITWLDSKTGKPKTASFQFIRPLKDTILHPQLIVALGWTGTINRAIKAAARK
jgi:hypothetical protein